MTKDRIACVLIPDFAMAVCLRMDASLCGQPVVLAETESDSSPVYAASKEAADTSVTREMTIAQARSYCPELVVKLRSTKTENAASDKIRHLLFTASPLIEQADDGCFFLDASGLNWLYKDEPQLAMKLLSLITPLKLPVKVGIAANKFVARVAALVSSVDSFTVVEAGAKRRFLNHLSVDYLPLPEDIREKLLALGLKTIGQVAAFPSNEMTTRFGSEGADISRLSRGEDTDFFLPQQSRTQLFARVSLFEPLQSAQAVVLHVEKTLTGLLEKLSRNDRGCSRVDIKLHLEDRTETTLSLALKQPVGDAHKFIRLLIQRLSGLRLSCRITDITVTIPEIIPLVSSQLELIRAAGSFNNQQLQNSRIPGELRRVNLLSPVINDSVLPDHNFGFRPIGSFRKQSGENHRTPTCSYAINPVAGLRLLHPPQKANVTTSGKTLKQLKLKADTRPIIKQKGPWELSGGWWSRGFDRLYYEIQTEDHRLYLLYFDRQTPGWYVQGVFD